MQIRDRIRELRRVPANQLRPNPRNWRTHPKAQMDAIRGILAEVGYAGASIARELADGTLELIDGHARAEVSGDAVVPVLVLDVTEEEANKLLATFDPIGAMAGLDPDKLKALLGEVRVESAAVDDLLRSLLPEHLEVGSPLGGGDGFDGTPAGEDDGPARSSAGDLWEIAGRHRLLVGSCTEAANVSRLFAGEVPAIMVTDPPYGVEYDPTWRHKAGINKSGRTGAVSNDDQADWTDAWRLFPGNVAYVWHGALHGATVALSLGAAGFRVRAQLVWVKPRLVLSRGHYHWKHEPVLVAERSGEDPEGELGYYAVRQGAAAAWCGGRKQTTVWEIGFSGEVQTRHGTQKPVECMARPIASHGREGDAVYDPFLGSGTTLIAAHRLGRACFGCELDPRYADVILNRAEAEGLTCAKSE